VSVFGGKRLRFLLDLAEELTWLKDNAGADVAERWYPAQLAYWKRWCPKGENSLEQRITMSTVERKK
jgi:hypothetical protein